MKLLLDEMLSPAIARALKDRGHDVEAVKEHPQWQSVADAALLEIARAESRAVVTSNLRDFRPLHAQAVVARGAGHAGMVFVPTDFRLRRSDVGPIVTGLEAILLAHRGDDGLANREAWL